MSRLSLFVHVALAASLLIASACNQDRRRPVIVPNEGDYRIPLGGTYVEKGAVATDAEDGILDSAEIAIDTSGLRNDSVAYFEVVYSISDMAGNRGTAVRELGVFAAGKDYSGSYLLSDSCSDSTMSDYTVTITVSPLDSNLLLLSNIRDLGPAEEVGLLVSGALRTRLSLNDSLPDFSYLGAGTLRYGTLDSLVIDLNYTQTDTAGTVNCQAVLVRQ